MPLCVVPAPCREGLGVTLQLARELELSVGIPWALREVVPGVP